MKNKAIITGDFMTTGSCIPCWCMELYSCFSSQWAML